MPGSTKTFAFDGMPTMEHTETKVPVYPGPKIDAASVQPYESAMVSCFNYKGLAGYVEGRETKEMIMLRPKPVPAPILPLDAPGAVSRADLRAKLQHENSIAAAQLEAYKKDKDQEVWQIIDDSLRPHALSKLKVLEVTHRLVAEDDTLHNGPAAWKAVKANGNAARRRACLAAA